MKSRRQKNDRARPGEPVTAVVLIDGDALRRSVAENLTARGVACVSADDHEHADRLVSDGAFDVVVMDGVWAKRGAARRGVFGAVRRLAEAHPTTGVIVVVDRPGMEEAIAAMQAGAADLIPTGAGEDELTRRVLAAAGRSASARERWEQREKRAEKLRRLCRGLNHSRHELTRQISGLCENLAGAYRELAEQMSLVNVGSEFNALIRQELDLESLLRVGMEYLLGKTGPTNAAVFLPATTGDYSLGAYVNYDCPKDSAEVLMDQLAASVAPRLDGEDGVVSMDTAEALRARLGDGAEWLEGMSVMSAACRHEKECLAVIVLFRPRGAPLTEEVGRVFGVMAGLFARQLARVIHVHHRHLPKHKWGFPGDHGDPAGGADDIDLAA